MSLLRVLLASSLLTLAVTATPAQTNRDDRGVTTSTDPERAAAVERHAQELKAQQQKAQAPMAAQREQRHAQRHMKQHPAGKHAKRHATQHDKQMAHKPARHKAPKKPA